MAVPMPADRGPAIIDAAQRLRPAPVPRPLQLLVQLALDHGLDKAAHPITHRGFNRIEPIIEKIHSCIGDRLRGIRLRGNALHGVVSYPTLKRRMIRGSSPRRLRHLQFLPTPRRDPRMRIGLTKLREGPETIMP